MGRTFDEAFSIIDYGTTDRNNIKAQVKRLSFSDERDFESAAEAAEDWYR